MYIFNGFVYGREKKDGIKVTEVRTLNDRMMILRFSTGEQRLFDASELKGAAFEPLRDEQIFRSAQLSHGVVTWNNGEIDCAAEYMYEHSYEYEYV